MSFPVKLTQHYLKAIGFILTMLLAGHFVSYGQQSTGIKASLQVSDTFIQVNNKELKDITLHIKNNDVVPFNGYVLFKCQKGVRIATKDSVAVKLEPGKDAYLASKIYINQGTTDQHMLVQIQLNDSDNHLIDSSLVKLFLVANKLLTLNIEEPGFVLPAVGTILRIPVRLSNRGNVPQSGVLVIAFPSALRDKTNKSISFTLNPSFDTVIVFERKVSRDMVRLGTMNVNINGIYNDDGNLFGSLLLSIQNLSSKRTFGEGLGERSLMPSNVITLGVQNAFEAGENYYIRSRGDYDFKNGTIGYNFNLNKWKTPSENITINGTNIDFSYKQVGARIGNITQNSELSFTGRGGEGFVYLDSAKNNKVYAGYLDKSINLYSNENFPSFGSSSWVGYEFDNQLVNSNTSFTHDVDKIAQAKSELLVSNLIWKINSAFSADMKGGIARTVSTSGNNESRNSMAAGLNFFGALSKNFNISGNNSFATAYYPGARRGTLFLNESALWRLKKSTISSTIIYSDAAPKYINRFSSLTTSNNKSTTGDFTYNKSMGAMSMSFSAQYYSEKGNWFYNGNSQDGNMTALRGSYMISYNPVKSQQALYFKTDIGAYQSNLSEGNKLQFKSMLTYNLMNFRIMGSIQKGNFYLSDVFQEYFAGFNSYRLNILPSTTIYFFNRSLRWDAGVGYNRDFYANSLLLNSNLALNLGPVAFFSNVQYNIYSGSTSYKNIQFGVSYFLPEKHVGKVNNSKIEVFVFYDLNRNGTYDKTDSVASGILVHIGKTILMSGKDGKIVYSKLPADNYSIYLPTQNGWYGRDNFVKLKEKETKSFTIPLSQTGVVHGSISYEFDATYSMSVNRDKAWQSIVAVDAEGKRFETKTDEGGNYNLYLPIGVYTIMVDNLPNQIELILKNNNIQPLNVKSGEIINGIDFILKVKQRKVEIKKFGKQK